MKKPKVLFLIPLMLLSSLLLVPNVAHATGQVSVNGGLPIIGSAGQTSISVPVNIAGSDPLNGFDIQVFADQTILDGNPSGWFPFSHGSVLNNTGVSLRLSIECIDGIVIVGTCSLGTDGPGVVHLAAAVQGATTSGTTSGLLFTINYKIVGSTTNTPVIFVSSSTGCKGTSVPGVCVTISNGASLTPLSETAVGTTFANLIDYTMTPQFPKLSTPGAAISDAIKYVSEGGFSDSLSEGVMITPSTGLTCKLASASTMSPNTVDLISSTTGSDTLTCSGSTGSYSVVVTATGLFTGTTHSVTIPVLVAAAGFSSTLSKSSVTVPRGNSDSTTTINVQGVSGFSGLVNLTAFSATTGITGFATPSIVTLTPDGSGYSTAKSALTVSVASTVANGTFTLSVTGGATLSVMVPVQDFSLNANPNAISIPRGGSVVSTIVLGSIGNFHGNVSLSAMISVQGADPDGVTNNIVPGFLPSTVPLTAGGTSQAAFFAPTFRSFPVNPATDTATGNYTATITATGGGITHTASVAFNIFDFLLGPTFCPGGTTVFTSPNGNNPTVGIGLQCTTLTITNQTVADGGVAGTLWLQVSSVNGLSTAGVTGGVMGAGNPQVPARGQFVPELGHKVCLAQTFFANGTQIPYSFLRANGPIIRPGSFSGCRFDAFLVPNDLQGGFAGVFPPPAPQAPFNNPDFIDITAEALHNTALGTYFFNICAFSGSLFSCQKLTLVVAGAPVIHQFTFDHRLSLSKTANTQSFKVGIESADPTLTLNVQITITGIDQAGDTFTVFSAVFTLAPGQTINNIILPVTLNKSEIGQTFAFSTSLSVGLDPLRLTGTSTVSSTLGVSGVGLHISSTFIVLA